MRERVATVVFEFPDTSQIRHMGKPPRPGTRVRSPRGPVFTVAEVIDWGSNTYTATCVGTSWRAPVPKQTSDQVKQPAKQTARPKDSLSPRAIKRRWRYRNYIP